MSDLYIFLINAWYFLVPIPFLLWWGLHDDEPKPYQDQRHRFARRL